MDRMLLGVVVIAAGTIMVCTRPTCDVRGCVWLFAQAVCGFWISTDALPVLLESPDLSGIMEWFCPVGNAGLPVNAVDTVFWTFSLPVTFLCSLFWVSFLIHDARQLRSVQVGIAQSRGDVSGHLPRRLATVKRE